MALWKSLGLIYLLTWIIHGIGFWLMKRNATGYYYAHMMHLEHVIRNQLLMLLGSLYIWKRVSTAFLFDSNVAVVKYAKSGDEDDDDTNDRDRQQQQQRSRRSPPRRTFASLVQPNSKKYKIYRVLIYATVLVFLFLVHLSQFTNYFANATEPRWISMISLSCFGFWIHLVAFLLMFSIINFIVRFAQSKSCGQKVCNPIFTRFSIVRELLINYKWQTYIALGLSVVFTVFLLWSAASGPHIVRVDVRLKNLPKSMDGLTIALLTDLHAGPTVGRSHFERAVETTNAEKPDIVAIVGDLVDGAMDNLKPVVEPIGRLKAKYGVYFSTGNHEMYFGSVDDWIAFLKSMGVHVLRNENVKIRPTVDGQPAKSHDGDQVCLAGADDITAAKTRIDGHRMDLRAAVNTCNTNYPVILMAHNPKAAKEALDTLDRRVDLILCGHTHAGQIPFMAPVMYFTMPYFHGYYEPRTQSFNNRSVVYVSSGIKFVGPPMKMPFLSQIDLLTLRREE